MTRTTATAIGFAAVLLWSLLAYFTAASGAMPPFQLTAITFGIGGIAGVALWAFRPAAAKALRQPWPTSSHSATRRWWKPDCSTTSGRC